MDQRWAQDKSGLLIPSELAARMDQDDRACETQRRRLEIKFGSLQTLATIIALVVGLAGLWMARSAYDDQRSANRTQKELADLQKSREGRKYADRVTWWTEAPSGGGSIIHVENRSSVAISPIAIVNNPQPSFELVNDHDSLLSILGVSPCTAASIEIPPNAEDFGSKFASLLFSDPLGTWINHGANAMAYNVSGRVISGQNFTHRSADFWIKGNLVGSFPIGRVPLSDCGQST